MLYLGHQGGHVVPRGDVGAGGDEDVGVGVVRVPDGLGHVQVLSIPTLSSHNSVSCITIIMDFYPVLSKHCCKTTCMRSGIFKNNKLYICTEKYSSILERLIGDFSKDLECHYTNI